RWLDERHMLWLQPNLAKYRDFLLNEYLGRDGKPLSPNSVKAHLSSIRGRYKALLRDNDTRDRLYNMTPQDASPSDRKALVDEVLKRLSNAIEPQTAPVKVVTRQDVRDDEHLRLTSSQASQLMAMPGTTTLLGLRDTTVIALMLCTGIREAELCALDVPDLRQRLGGALSLHVREGKGSKERLIPYGELEWSLAIADRWMENAGIGKGPVLRGFYKGGKAVRSTRLTVRAINQILERYPIMIDGELRKVHPHDLRRTYARRLYEAGMDLLAIRDNLGHADSRTTLKYIGTMDVDQRKPPTVYNFDLSSLVSSNNTGE
ncbi:MAG: tyrosine-type recombinase/integrase, partial [Anaerolineae bacterium]|nr:tyrosine-type recombinase/integrase [Anaerolineae bacterium]